MYIFGFIFICVLGTLLHFTYEWSHHKKIVAIFSAVNESTWEHTKIALVPFFAWSLIDQFSYGLNPNYFIAKGLGILIILFLMPSLYYGYILFFKKHNLVYDIISFYLVIFASQLAGEYILSLNSLATELSYASLIIILITLINTLIFTFYPRKNFLFKDPITKSYGLDAHSCMHKH